MCSQCLHVWWLQWHGFCKVSLRKSWSTIIAGCLLAPSRTNLLPSITCSTVVVSKQLSHFFSTRPLQTIIIHCCWQYRIDPRYDAYICISRLELGFAFCCSYIHHMYVWSYKTCSATAGWKFWYGLALRHGLLIKFRPYQDQLYRQIIWICLTPMWR